MGKYSEVSREELSEIEFSGNYETAEVSLKILDFLSENTKEISVRTALTILEDAKKMLLQIDGI